MALAKMPGKAKKTGTQVKVAVRKVGTSKVVGYGAHSVKKKAR